MRFRVAALILPVLGCLAFLARPLPASACEVAPGSKVELNATSYKPGDPLQATFWFETDGNCANDHPHLKITQNIGGNLYTWGETDCPSAGGPGGSFCSLVNDGKTFQYYVTGEWGESAGYSKGYLEGWAYLGGNLLVKTAPLETTNTSATEGGAAPSVPQQQAPKPVEAVLSVAFGKLTSTANIAVYLATVFNYSIQLVSILAIVMTVWGGMKYLTAGGDQSRVTAARETIRNAVTGLILALAALLILNTVNPQLTQFKAIVATPVARGLAGNLNTNWCEDVVEKQALLEVDPKVGHCGDLGTVKPGPSAPAGTTVVANTCTFKNCDVYGQACAPTGPNKYECVRCEDMTDERLALLKGGSSPSGFSDADCAPYANLFSNKKGYFACVHGTDSGFGKGIRACEVLRVDCANVKSCDDYTTYVAVYPPGAPSTGYGATYERSCDLGTVGACVKGTFANGEVSIVPKSSGHLERVCSADPCGVGPCKTEQNTGLSKFELIIGLAIFNDANVVYCRKQ